MAELPTRFKSSSSSMSMCQLQLAKFLQGKYLCAMTMLQTLAVIPSCTYGKPLDCNVAQINWSVMALGLSGCLVLVIC